MEVRLRGPSVCQCQYVYSLMHVYKIVLHIHRLRCMAWIALTNKMADTRVSSRQLGYAYQIFVKEISRSETSGRIYNLCPSDVYMLVLSACYIT